MLKVIVRNEGQYLYQDVPFTLLRWPIIPIDTRPITIVEKSQTKFFSKKIIRNIAQQNPWAFAPRYELLCIDGVDYEIRDIRNLNESAINRIERRGINTQTYKLDVQPLTSRAGIEPRKNLLSSFLVNNRGFLTFKPSRSAWESTLSRCGIRDRFIYESCKLDRPLPIINQIIHVRSLPYPNLAEEKYTVKMVRHYIFRSKPSEYFFEAYAASNYAVTIVRNSSVFSLGTVNVNYVNEYETIV